MMTRLYQRQYQNEIDSLVRTVKIVTKDIGMKFGIGKCSVTAMKMGKVVKCNGTKLENVEEISQIGEEGYKYLGILEKGDICQKEMKESIRKEYFKRLKATLKLKFNAKNVFQAINTLVVPTVRYSAGIIEWTKEGVKEMDRETRKIITMYGGLHPRSNVERLYLPRSEGGRGLVSIEDCVNNERQNLALYAIRSNEKLTIAATTELKLEKFINVQNRLERRKQHLTEWKEKAVYSQLLRETESTDDGNRWEWLKQGKLKRETKSILCAAQEQALQVNAIKYSIDKTSNTPL